MQIISLHSTNIQLGVCKGALQDVIKGREKDCTAQLP